MKKVFYVIFILSTISMVSNAQKTFYDFTVSDISGNEFPLVNLKGKKVLVVNTASKCGFTPQYEGLQQLYETYGDKDFVVIGFPANNFARQEPGTNEEIALFCSSNYDVTFPMMGKISVKGDDQHPLYRWLTTKSENGVEDSKVSWNFQKYLIDENGQLVGSMAPSKKPDDQEIIDWITR